jgi:hypothetical protein
MDMFCFHAIEVLCLIQPFLRQLKHTWHQYSAWYAQRDSKEPIVLFNYNFQISLWQTKGRFTHTMPFPCRFHDVPLPLLCHDPATTVPLPCQSPIVPNACMSPICRLWTADANSHIPCCSPAVALRGRFQKGIFVAWQGNGMACVNPTRPHCVNQMGKAQSKSLVKRHGREMAWERHGNGMVCVNPP